MERDYQDQKVIVPKRGIPEDEVYGPLFRQIEQALDELKSRGARKDRVWLALLHYQNQWKPAYKIGMKDREIAEQKYER